MWSRSWEKGWAGGADLLKYFCEGTSFEERLVDVGGKI